VLVMLKMVLHFKLTMQVTMTMTMLWSLGVSIRRSTTPKPMWCSGILSAQVDTSEKLQCHNLFQIFFVIKDCRVCTIIDGGSCNNLVSVDFVTKIGLTTCLHTHPYYIQWLNNSGNAKVTHTTRVHFSIGTYHDYSNCDVVPKQACSLLLGHPWEFDTDTIQHGRSNRYTLVHNGKKITLLPLTPNEIVQCDRAIAETARRESKIQHASPIKHEKSYYACNKI
jgi:hypothetical protein